MTDRNHVRDALHLSYAATAWTALSGTIAVVVGLAAASTALVGTGADVVADMVSSIVLVWRFRAELHGHPTSGHAEERAERVAAIALLLVAIGIAVTAILRLVADSGAESSAASIVVAAASAVVLPAFALVKYRIAPLVPSPALRVDGHITLVGAVMAVITLAGLAATSSLGWTWADPAAALIVAGLAATIGVDTLRTAAPASDRD
ncbi:MAG: cation transporter [Marmoricola sp.]